MTDAPTAAAPSVAGGAVAPEGASPGTPLGEAAPAAGAAPNGAPAAPSSLAGAAKAPEAAPAAAPFDASKLTLPEGFKSDDPALKSLGEVIGDEKLSPQERAQKLVDLHTTAVKAASEAISTAYTETQTKWINELKADPDFSAGRDSPKVQSIGRLFDSLPDKGAAVREALDLTGAGNNPAVVKALSFFAEQLTEGRMVPGSPTAGRPANMAEAFYPNMAKGS